MEINELRLGRIPYANLFPVFHYLDANSNGAGYSYVENAPSKLNRMLRDGHLDVSPSSSIEYLRNKDQYDIIPELSVSSLGPIKSILLFTKVPFSELDGNAIAVTSDSETSTALLKIILKNFYAMDCSFWPTDQRQVDETLKSFAAVLHIGDTAMIEANRLSSMFIMQPPPPVPSAITAGRERIMAESVPVPEHRPPLPVYAYDLGEIWQRHTGLPFVYALWLARKDLGAEKKRAVQALTEDLMKAKRFATANFPGIASEAPHLENIPRRELIRYWEIISYDFTEKHRAGLKLFEKYAKEL